jgi:hypothetical protein
VVAAGSVFGPAAMRFLEPLAVFYGLGIVIVFCNQATDAFETTDQYGAAY